MTALTWRNVDTPNFTPAIQGQNNATELLSRAFGGLRQGINDFQTDPLERSATVLANAIKDQQLTQDQYTFGRAQQQDQAMANAAPILNQALLLNQQGKAKESAALLEANFDKVGALRPDQVNTVLTSGQNIATTGLRYGSDLFDFGSKSRNYEDQQVLEALSGNILSQVNTPQGAVAALEANRSNLTPVQYSKAQQMVAKMFPGSYGNTAGTPTAGGAISSAVGSNNVPVSALFSITRSSESGNRQIDPATGKPITSSAGAIGIMQVMPATGPEAAKLAGVAWDPVKYRNDSNYNQKIGEAYLSKQFNDFGNDPAMAWAAYNAGPGALRKAMAAADKEGNPDGWLQKLPSETQNYVAKNMNLLSEQLPNLGATRRTTENAVVDLASQRNQQSGTVADKFLQTVGDQRFVSEVLPDLKKNSSFAKVPEGVITGMLNRIIDRSGENGGQRVNAATAAQILLASTDKADDDGGFISPRRLARNYEQWIRGVIPGGKSFEDFTPNLAGGIRINDDKVDANIQLATSGSLADIALSQKSKVANAAKLNEYQTQLDQQEQLYRDTAARAEALPGLRSQLPAIQARIVNLNNQLRALQSTVPNTRPAAKSKSPSPDRLNELLTRFSQ